MQYPSVVFPNDFLDRETERQQRLQQEARKSLEQKKAQLRNADQQKRETSELPAQRPHHTAAAMPAVAADQAAPASAGESVDRLRTIPEIRSALVPIDEAVEGDHWSKPFLLSKADVEPWTSYLQGYYASRLFPGGVTGSVPDLLAIDVAVQALLQLKGVSPRYIVEPVVQINQPAEFLDLATELRNCRDRVQAKSLTSVANDVHEAQLVKAIERGRELGDNLYHALVGEGFSNLIRAWERIYKRKPTVNELHQMLSNGSVRIMPDAPAAPPPELRPRPMPERAPQAPAVKRQPELQAQAQSQPQLRSAPVEEKPPQAKPATVQAVPPSRVNAVVADDDGDTDVSKLFAKPPGLARWQKILLQLFHIALCGAAITAYFLVV